MFVFRAIAWLFIALAIALLGADAVSSLENGLTLRTTGDILMLFGVDGMALADAAPNGVSQVLGATVNFFPWAILGAIGLLLTLVFRPID
ncbi:MAG: hypothetical protein AAFR11_01295 [Pseudomonadota bacterium]